MNTYCINCKNSCEEVIPTFNCKFQMDKRELRTETINETIAGLENAKNLLEQLRDETEVIQDVYQFPLASAETISMAYAQLPYEEKRKVYSKLFTLEYLGDSIDNKLILISLIASFTLGVRKKQPELSVFDCVKRLIPNDYTDAILKKQFDDYLETISIIVDDYLLGVSKGNTFGLKTAAELKDKVNEIINNRTPF